MRKEFIIITRTESNQKLLCVYINILIPLIIQLNFSLLSVRTYFRIGNL